MNLLIAFVNPKLYDINNLKRLNLEEKKLFLICPYDFIYYLFYLRNKILLKPFNFYRKETETYLKKNFSKLEIKSLKPNILDIIYFFPLSFQKAIINTIKLSKILKGNRSRLYSNGIDITGYSLDSMARFLGKKFRIEEENSVQNILVSFIYLLLLEIYINWFVSKFKNQNIDKVIINHNVYCESGLFGEYTQKFFKAKIILVQNMFKDIIKIDDVKKDLFCYIPNLKNSNEENKEFFWYSKNAIRGQKDLATKEIDLNRILVVMHTFADASHIHIKSENDPIFITYYHWIKQTLEFAKSLKHQNFIFRSHPYGLKFHPKDKFTLLKLFSNLPRNIKFEDSTLDKDTSYHFEKSIPIIVSYKGSINLEMGCSGINIVSMALRTGNEFSIVPKSLEHYKEILEGKINPKKFYLSEDQINEYRKMETRLKSFIIEPNFN